MLAYIIIGFVFVMLIGNIMGARPNDSETALDNIRMMARQLALMPSLLPTPDWLKTTQKTIIIYSVVDDNWRLPLAYYLNDNGHWQRINNAPISERQSDINFFKKSERLIGQIELAPTLLPFVQGLVIKANSVAVVFDDGAFAKSLKDSTEADIKAQLLALKTQLLAWGNRVLAV